MYIAWRLKSEFGMPKDYTMYCISYVCSMRRACRYWKIHSVGITIIGSYSMSTSRGVCLHNSFNAEVVRLFRFAVGLLSYTCNSYGFPEIWLVRERLQNYHNYYRSTQYSLRDSSYDSFELFKLV